MKVHWRHLANTIELVHPSAHSSPQSKSTGSAVLHSSRQKRPILYNGCPYPPELPRSIGLSGLHLTRDAFGQCEPTTQTAPRSVQPCLHRWPRSVPIIMAALCNRGAIIFLPCDFYLSIFYLSFFSFPRLISAATDWISTILLHMAWP